MMLSIFSVACWPSVYILRGEEMSVQILYFLYPPNGSLLAPHFLGREPPCPLQVQGPLSQLLQGWISAQQCPPESPSSPLPGAFALAPAFGPTPSAGPAWTGAGSSGPGGWRQRLQQLPVAAAAAAAPVAAAAAAAPGAGVPPRGLAGPALAHLHPLGS